MPQKQRRPVYVVVKKLEGVYDGDGEQAVIIIAIRQTWIAAETIRAGHEGAEVVKKHLV
jgi:hypothetical protein